MLSPFPAQLMGNQQKSPGGEAGAFLVTCLFDQSR
jgi:hypothetical protein